MPDCFSCIIASRLICYTFFSDMGLDTKIFKCCGCIVTTSQPLHNTVCYNTVLDITQFKDGPQKCIDYIEKGP